MHRYELDPIETSRVLPRREAGTATRPGATLWRLHLPPIG